MATSGPSGSERKKSAPAIPPIVTQQPPSAEASSDEEEGEEEEDDEDENDAIGTGVDLSAAQSSSSAQRSRSQSIQMANKAKFGSKGALHSPVGSAHSFDLQVRFYTLSNISWCSFKDNTFVFEFSTRSNMIFSIFD